MFANMDGYLLTVMLVRIQKYPLNQVVAILVTSYVDEWDAWTIRTGCCDDTKIALQKIGTTNFETLLYHFRRKLVDAIVV